MLPPPQFFEFGVMSGVWGEYSQEMKHRVRNEALAASHPCTVYCGPQVPLDLLLFPNSNNSKAKPMINLDYLTIDGM